MNTPDPVAVPPHGPNPAGAPGAGRPPTPAPPALPPVVTVASRYGSGGTTIAPRVADRLGVPYLDRAIPAAVAERMGVPAEAIGAVDEQPHSRADRLFAWLARVPVVTYGPGSSRHLDEQERRIRAEIARFLAQSRRTGGVVLGRGGAVVLRDVPGALHVHLGGPFAARVARTMEVEGVDRRTAERRIRLNDRARIGYVRDAYGVDGEDPSLYHLMIESTAFSIDACVDVIVAASRARRAASTPVTR
ncbi:AAA family ATPase [Planosporangium thailandense]|uniref:cytidylate kinase-like family protein n=1 Tax=Planosporangium thailandense TaxID=765197 RepID=UPI00197BCE73|nr:cytidylate kinase-like family protein [Planosporangium thailandense]